MDARRGAIAAAGAEQGSLKLAVFGGFSLMFGTRLVDLRGAKLQALVAFLALDDGPSASRSRLAGMLWSDSDEERARASLRQALLQVRVACADAGAPVFIAGKSDVVVDRKLLAVDVWQIVEAAERGEVHTLLHEFVRPFESALPGLEDVDPSFRIWLMAKRQAWNDRVLRALERALIDRDDARAEPIAAALLRLDPTHEPACRAIMRSRVAAGDLAGALRAYKTLWDVLDDEFGVEPSSDTQALAVRIKLTTGGQSERAEPILLSMNVAPAQPSLVPGNGVASPAVQAASKIVLVVEAFANDQLPAQNGYRVHGFRHELIACLTRFREWTICDSARQPERNLAASSDLQLFRIATTVLDGRDEIRLVLTLMDEATGQFIWSDRFAINLETWFDVQQTIVARLATSLNVHVSAERLTRLTPAREMPSAVHDLWLVGQSLVNGYSPPDWRRAIEIFTDVTRRAPSFSPAYSSLVQLLNQTHLVHPGARRERDRENQALDFAKTAARLDPLDSRAQLCLGWAHAMAKHYDDAETFLRLATDLNVNDPWTIVSAAHGLAFCGRREEARDYSARAMAVALPPSRVHWGYQVGTRFLCGDFLGAVEAADRAEDVILNLSGWRTAALFHSGRADDARREAARFITRVRSVWSIPGAPSEEEIARWFLHLFPIRDPEAWEALRSGLAGAGVPVGTARHHDW